MCKKYINKHMTEKWNVNFDNNLNDAHLFYHKRNCFPKKLGFSRIDPLPLLEGWWKFPRVSRRKGSMEFHQVYQEVKKSSFPKGVNQCKRGYARSGTYFCQQKVENRPKKRCPLKPPEKLWFITHGASEASGVRNFWHF